MITRIRMPNCSLALTGIAGSATGERPLAIISLAECSYLSASLKDTSAAAMTTAEVKVRVGMSDAGPWLTVPTGCIGSGGTATMTVSAPLAGPIDVRAFSHAALEITTAEASKSADLVLVAKGGTE